MLRQVAEGVFVHESRFVQSNAVVVEGVDGVLLVDAGIHTDELDCLATDLADSGRTVVAAFSTHPHWDHLLWHAPLGSPPRYATAACEESSRMRLARGIEAVAKAVGIPDDVPLDLIGRISALPAGATHVPWDGPVVRIVEHRAHAPGHAGLIVEQAGVLVAGDMLSDVLVPMLDLNGAAQPIADYLTALDRLEDAAHGVSVVIPGHGSVGGPDDLRARIDQDRAYVEAVRDGRDVDDPRIGPSAAPGWDWVAGVHERQVARLAELGAPSS